MNKTLRDLRIEKNLTLEELSKISNVSKNCIVSLENGKNKNPLVSTVFKLSIALKCNVWDLFEIILKD